MGRKSRESTPCDVEALAEAFDLLFDGGALGRRVMGVGVSSRRLDGARRRRRRRGH